MVSAPCQFVLAARVVRHDDQQIQIAVLVRLAPGVRAEQVYLQRMQRLDQTLDDLIQQTRQKIGTVPYFSGAHR